jgi:hypothetical protein
VEYLEVTLPAAMLGFFEGTRSTPGKLSVWEAASGLNRPVLERCKLERVAGAGRAPAG